MRLLVLAVSLVATPLVAAAAEPQEVRRAVEARRLTRELTLDSAGGRASRGIVVLSDGRFTGDRLAVRKRTLAIKATRLLRF